MKALWITGAVAGAAALAVPAAPSETRESAAEVRLDQAIEQAIHAEGPFLTAEEQALIQRKCGYAPGSAESESLNMSDGVLHCSNGRKVDDPEVRAMVAVVRPRIQARVRGIMSRPEIKEAIASVSREEVQKALRGLERDWGK